MKTIRGSSRARADATISALQHRLEDVTARLAVVESEGGASTPSGSAKHSRRWLMTAGAGVAAAGVGAVLGTPEQASAAAGSDMVIGAANDSGTTPTTLTASANPGPSLDVTNSNAAGYAAIRGTAVGVSGLIGTDQAALIGDTNVVGTSGTGGGSSQYYGVFGLSASANYAGVIGQSTGGGAGVMGFSASGIDLKAGASGRIQQLLKSVAGAPTGTSTSYLAGEQIRDAVGQMWICTVSGPPGTWQKVAAVAPGANGGSTNMLATPTRLYDSRSGQPSDITTPKQQLQNGAANTLPLTATGQGGIPTGAIGIIGTLTITNTNGAGYLALYPTGGSVPATSNINWTADGQTVAASYTCALSTGSPGGGSVTIYNGGGATDVILDVAGYIY